MSYVSGCNDKRHIPPLLIDFGVLSSGGNFAAVTCILAKERNGPKISFQCLLYPSTDFTFKREEKVVEPKQGGSALDLKAIK
ncbi:unnamed protein product [Umbelopsis sp. WA50703]